MKFLGRYSIMSNANDSYRVTPDKDTVDAFDADEADQYVDFERGIIVFDLEGADE